MSREEGKPGNGMPLRATVEDGRLTISIGVDTLKFAFENGEDNNPWDDRGLNTVRTYSISDAMEFAKDICHEMNDEGEDGSTPLTRFLDKMMNEAVEQGSLGIHDPDGNDSEY